MALRKMHQEKFPSDNELHQEIGESFELRELMHTKKELVNILLGSNLI